MNNKKYVQCLLEKENLNEISSKSLVGRVEDYKQEKTEWDNHYKDLMSGYKAELSNPETPMSRRVKAKDEIRALSIINKKKQDLFKHKWQQILLAKNQLKAQYYR